MRQSLGTSVFAGMLGVTGFGLLFTPAFYVMAKRVATLSARGSASAAATTAAEVTGRQP